MTSDPDKREERRASYDSRPGINARKDRDAPRQGADRGKRSQFTGRSDRAPRADGQDRPRRDGDRPQRSFDGDRPRRDGDRPQRSFDGDRPRRDGDRPQRSFDGDRPRRPYRSDDARGERGDRPQRSYDGDRPRRDGDRPRRDGDRPQRSFDGDRPRRPYRGDDARGERGDRPQRPYDGDRPRRDGDRPRRDGDRPRRDGDRPQRSYDGDRPRRDGDRPQRSFDGDRPRRPYRGDDARGERGDRPQRSFDRDRPRRDGDRPQRSFDGDRPRRSYRDDDRGPRGARPDRAPRKDRGGRERPESEERTARVAGVPLVKSQIFEAPELPEEITYGQLDRTVRARLRTLSKDNAEDVGRHLIMAGHLIDIDPELAYRHAQVASQRGGRVDVVREATALTAYATGRYAEALREFRTVRRLGGAVEHLPLMADCERGLGRPERALAIADEPDARALPQDAALEMQIVVAGARLDMGDAEAASLVLSRLNPQGPEQQARVDEAKVAVLRALGKEKEADALEAAITEPVEEDVEEDIVLYDTAELPEPDVDDENDVDDSDEPELESVAETETDTETAAAGDDRHGDAHR